MLAVWRGSRGRGAAHRDSVEGIVMPRTHLYAFLLAMPIAAFCESTAWGQWYADQLIGYSAAAPGYENRINDVLGPVDGKYVSFTGSSSSESGWFTVSFSNGAVQDEVGNDVTVHLELDWNSFEGFSVYASNNNADWYPLGNTGPGNGLTGPQQIDYDLAASGLNHARFLQIRNNSLPTNGYEGPELDAVSVASIAPSAFESPIYNPTNGHYYEYIDNTGDHISWDQANAAASSKRHKGLRGHLATVTDAQENQFVTNLISGGNTYQYFLGGQQPTGTSEPHGGWEWVTGESWTYTNWNPSEPTDHFADYAIVNPNDGVTPEREDALGIYKVNAGPGRTAGDWNDTYREGPTPLGYVVEYEPATPAPTPAPVSPVILPDPNITPEPTQKNLVLITHGWDDHADGGWPQDMALATASEVNDTAHWVADWYDWSEDADTPWNPNEACLRAQLHGKDLGKQIAALGFDHIHLVAHSAGAWLIEVASREIQELAPSTDIHLTFLDPYVPMASAANAAKLGTELDSHTGDFFSENYYVRDVNTDLPFGGVTSMDLPYAHNVDITNVATLSPGFPLHGDPTVWYRDSITDPSSIKWQDEYGFVRSLEGGGFSASLNAAHYPIGNEARVLTKNWGGALDWLDSVLDNSDTGTVATTAGGMSMGTGSPVWSSILLDLPERADYIEFSYQFGGPGEGMLAVYFNDELVLLGDQRVDGMEVVGSDVLYIGDLLGEANWLTFRLDPLGEEQANLWVSNIDYGTVPEPTSVALFGTSAVVMLRRRRVA